MWGSKLNSHFIYFYVGMRTLKQRMRSAHVLGKAILVFWCLAYGKFHLTM